MRAKVNYPEVLSIEWLREMYLSKQLSPEDVISEIIRRSAEDEAMNIWITVPHMEFIKPYLDKLESLRFEDSPLWGIPFAIKDNIDLEGIPTTAGCPDYAYVPSENAAVVQRLIEAGAIPVGKANLDQFATGLVGTRSPYGETHNSIRKELISGGSSSGSAVAVARGQAVFALGTDTAGSGRVPAALNNLVGYKPSLGAWSTKGVVPACASLDCVTVFSNTLADAMTVDSIARGIEENDPWSRLLPHPLPKVPEKIYLPNKEPDFFGPYAERYKKAWNTAVQRLGKLNIPVEYIDCSLFSEAAAILYEGPWVAERWADLGNFVNSHPGSTFPVTEQVLRSGDKEGHTAASVFNAMHKLQAYKLQTRKLLNNAVLVMPTCGGTWTRDQVREDTISTNSAMGLYTNHCNLLDLCAVAVPSGEAASGVPFGITMFALSESEGLICGGADVFLEETVGTARESENTRENIAADLLETQVKDTTLVAVCGLHMRGYPLEKQMVECGAHFICEAATAEKYKFVKLPTIPAKPGLIKNSKGGKSICLELWEMPKDTFGSFVTSIPSPLGICKIELINGTEVPGFICEGYASENAEDITDLGSWRNV